MVDGREGTDQLLWTSATQQACATHLSWPILVDTPDYLWDASFSSKLFYRWRHWDNKIREGSHAHLGSKSSMEPMLEPSRIEIYMLFCSGWGSIHGKVWDAFKGLSLQAPYLALNQFLRQSQTCYKDFLGLGSATLAVAWCSTREGLCLPEAIWQHLKVFLVCHSCGKVLWISHDERPRCCSIPCNTQMPCNEKELQISTEWALGLPQEAYITYYSDVPRADVGEVSKGDTIGLKDRVPRGSQFSWMELFHMCHNDSIYFPYEPRALWLSGLLATVHQLPCCWVVFSLMLDLLAWLHCILLVPGIAPDSWTY